VLSICFFYFLIVKKSRFIDGQSAVRGRASIIAASHAKATRDGVAFNSATRCPNGLSGPPGIIHEGRTILLLKDSGGEPLDRILESDHGQPLNLTRFLPIAIGLAKALGQVHRHGLIR
jgi:hypothetical protein